MTLLLILVCSGIISLQTMSTSLSFREFENLLPFHIWSWNTWYNFQSRVCCNLSRIHYPGSSSAKAIIVLISILRTYNPWTKNCLYNHILRNVFTRHMQLYVGEFYSMVKHCSGHTPWLSACRLYLKIQLNLCCETCCIEYSVNVDGESINVTSCYFS